MKLGYLVDKQFGKVAIYTRRGMMRANARWVNGTLEMHFPESIDERGIRLTIEQMRSGIERLRAKSAKSIVTYHDKQVIDCFHYTITLGYHHYQQKLISYGCDDEATGALFVRIPQGCDFTSSTVAKMVSSCMKELMRQRAAKHIIPLAQKVAADRGMKPSAFVIGSGMRKLGHCTRQGVIQLSYNLMFYPKELIEYVVCHELAHLIEFNHSPRFHAVCNRLCHGNESRLESLLKSHHLPLLK